MVEYFGIFFGNKESEKIFNSEKVHLEKLPNNFHCTFCFKPKSIKLFDEVVGKEINIAIVGYACDGKNSGFEIDFPNNFKKYFKNVDFNGKLKIPHITTSLGKFAKAVDTANLEFKKLDNPIFIKGKFGYFIREKDNSFISFKKENEELHIK